MTTVHVKLTPRDDDILESLYRDPKTARQVFRESLIYSQPFTSLDRAQDRLSMLVRGGYIQRQRALCAGDEQGSPPFWYSLTKRGFLERFGGDALPRAAFFRRLPSLHGLALAECNIRTFVALHQTRAAVIEEFVPENEDRYETGGGVVFPDATYRFQLATGQRYTFFLELDNSTETQVYRRLKASTIEEKIRRYERLHYELATGRELSPFRVLFVCTRSHVRAQNILDTARGIVREPRRSIFYAAYLDDYLRSDDPLHAPLFRDQQGTAVGLLPPPMALPCISNTRGWDQAVSQTGDGRKSRELVAAGRKSR